VVATEYDNAIAGFAALRARESADPDLNQDCGSILLTHGQPASSAIVLMHGITSSPRQFADLGRIFFDHDYNVLLPRMPLHGLHDRLSRLPSHLRAQDYTAYGMEAVHIARGLATGRLTVAGLSVSGVIAAWCAQHLAEVDQAVLIAPAFAPFRVPIRLARGLGQFGRRVPNLFIWWDPIRRARINHHCSSPRFSTHAMCEAFQLAADVHAAARRGPPRARSILCVTNKGDPAVNNRATATVLLDWRRSGAIIRSHEFSGELGRLHDFIGTYQPGARVDLVYPILFDLIDTEA
jgi:alpha-beta hydrolase superfamily lysophospholipase